MLLLLVSLLGYSQERISLGIVPLKDTLKIEWQFKNENKTPLVIVKYEVDCDCTWSEFSKEPIKPQESAKPVIYFYADTKGTFLKKIEFFLSDGTRRRVSLIGKVEKR